MMIAGKVKSGDKIEVQVDKEGAPVFVINGKKDEPKPEKKEPEKKEKK
jgi:hypothetical protein